MTGWFECVVKMITVTDAGQKVNKHDVTQNVKCEVNKSANGISCVAVPAIFDLEFTVTRLLTNQIGRFQLLAFFRKKVFRKAPDVVKTALECQLNFIKIFLSRLSRLPFFFSRTENLTAPIQLVTCYRRERDQRLD